MRSYTVLAARATMERMSAYAETLKRGGTAGRYLQRELAGMETAALAPEMLVDLLLATKVPQIFAESAVSGDGTDWTLEELRLLGDIGIAMPVTVYDNGLHSAPQIHEPPFPATLLFVPGALLRNERNQPPADWLEATKDGAIDRAGLYRLYERRLLPALLHADEIATEHGKKALITIPGLGCGQFAGPFRGKLGRELEFALKALLETHGKRLSHVTCVYYDPYDECDNTRSRIHGIEFLVRPLTRGNGARPQLCRPAAYAEAGDDFSNCELFSVVAWDHVSWPGNDYYAGARATDDGVKAAATTAIGAMTGVEGSYSPTKHGYLPPAPFRTWGDVVVSRGLRIEARGRLRVLDTEIP
ncbi:MAG: hypothetical protein BWY66_00311 [bacterium ADurb.Bin374]|nr:MAG: hypothetical protein BWY66_00311 [bacterium ADurb.Bin374]